MKRILQHLVTFSFLGLSLAGCGQILDDLRGKQVVNNGMDTARFKVNCELDVEKFAEIMHENIGPTIRCLGANLNLFIQVVESGKPGHLSRVALEQFLRRNRPDFKPEMVSALKAVFDLNFLITGEDANFISQQSIDKLIHFALVFNTEAALNFGPTFMNEAPATFALHQRHRERITNANRVVTMALRRIFNPNRGGQTHTLNIIDLLDAFRTTETTDGIDSVKKILFAKKILLGGDKEIITHHELERLVINFDQLALIALDVVRYKHIILDQSSILQLLRRDVNDLFDIIFQGGMGDRSQEVMATIDETLNGIKAFIPSHSFDLDKYRRLIIEGKQILMGGNDTEISGRDLRVLFDHSRSMLQTGTIFHRIYAKFKAPLDSPLPVTIKFDDYRHTYPEHQRELDQFERIVKNYRFMKGEFISPYFSRGWRRNADAVYEVALFEYLLKLVMQKYGSVSKGVGGYSMDPDQVVALFKKFEKELIDLELVMRRRTVPTAETASLLGILFQYQSDNNGLLDVNEATEFAVTLMSSMEVTKDMDNYFTEQGCPRDQFGRIEPACFKEYFFKGTCRFYRQYFPLLFESLGVTRNCEELQMTKANFDFLEVSIKASRSCHNYDDGAKEEIPYSKGDIQTLWTELMHVETTIIRWDTNLNNVMDYDEVMRAYSIYSHALDGFLVDKPWPIPKFKKQIYQYLVKYEEVPNEKNFSSIWRFIRFLVSFNKKASANRKTISSILYAISQENAKLHTGAPFLCRWMRDPQNIPEEDFTGPAARTVEEGPDFSYLLAPYLKFATP
jgi:hypothetical protein